MNRIKDEEEEVMSLSLRSGDNWISIPYSIPPLSPGIKASSRCPSAQRVSTCTIFTGVRFSATVKLFDVYTHSRNGGGGGGGSNIT